MKWTRRSWVLSQRYLADDTGRTFYPGDEYELRRALREPESLRSFEALCDARERLQAARGREVGRYAFDCLHGTSSRYTRERLRELSAVRRDIDAALEVARPFGLEEARRLEREARKLRRFLRAGPA